MITKLDNGTVFLEMGKGTLFSSVIRQNEKVFGLCFSNSATELEDGVVFSINTFKGVIGYIRPLVSMMEEFSKALDDTDETKIDFIKQINELKLFLESAWDEETSLEGENKEA